jgi:hypothetical protein
MTRKDFLRLTARGSAMFWAGGMLKASPLTFPQSASQEPSSSGIAARVGPAIEAYDGQGIHRTATDVDNRSAAWLVGEAKAAGGDARPEPFTISRIDVKSAFVEIGGRRVEGLPLFDGGFTEEAGVSGRLGAAGEAGGEIVLATIDAGGVSSEGRGLSELRKSAAVRAIVAVTNGAHAGLTPSNAVDFMSPYGVPVLQVSSEEGAWLAEQAKAHRDARLVASVARTNTPAQNVVARVAGSRPELPPVVVMTPRSGWWQCASERGGGLVCWLESIRAVAAARPPRTVLFVASSGHELGHYGLDQFIGGQPDLIKRAAAWIHFGANIGAADGRMRLQTSSDEIEAKALESATRAGAQIAQRVPRGSVPGGEARNIHIGGGRYASTLGSSNVFHSQADRWPSAVDVGAVARFATAFSQLAVRLASEA